MQEQYRLLVDEQLICGLQIHVGVSDRDLAVEITQRIARDLPILLALAASSPFWNGSDTGYASIRTIIWQRWPTAGATGPLTLRRRVRPAGRRPDQHRGDRGRQDGLLRRPAVLPRADPRAAGLRRLPGGRRRDPGRRAVPGAGGRGRARDRGRSAVRAGAAADPPRGDLAGGPRRACPATCSTTPATRGRSRPPIAVQSLVERLTPQLRRLGDYEQVSAADRGHPGPRQLRRPAAGGVRRARPAGGRRRARRERDRGRQPAGSCRTAPVLRTYRIRAGRRGRRTRRTRPAGLRRPGRGVPRDGDRRHPPQRAGQRDEWIADHGVTFGVEGSQQEFAVDLMPRIINPHEWAGPVGGAGPAGPGDRGVPARTATASSGCWPTACCRPTGWSARSAGATRRRGCPPAPSGRRSWGSTWSATSSAAGGCWRTTSGTRAGPRTPSRSGT